MLAIATTILSSLGRERIAARITFGALTCVVVACVALTSRAPFGQPELVATALGTSLGLGAALMVAAFYVRRETGGFVPLLTALRVLTALTIAGAVGAWIPTAGRLLTPIIAASIAGLYLVVLGATRELTRADAHALRALSGK